MIFISHKSGPDHEYALKIAKRLREEKISCWLAPESIPQGTDYAEEIVSAIKSCEYFVLLLSPEAAKSAHVRKEIDLALRYQKKILPILLENFQPPEKFEYLLADVQFKYMADFCEFEELVEKCKLGERTVTMSIQREPNRTATIIKGDYDQNMEYYIQEHFEDLDETVFAMGIDRSSRLDISSEKGILRYVMAELRKTYGVTMEQLQDLVNRAKIEQLGHADGQQEMLMKDTICIRVPITVQTDRGPLGKTVQLLFVANSQKKESFKVSGDVDEVEGVDSREIVLEVFRKCSQLGERAKTLMIGAMGTNGLEYPYEVITAEILNSFVFAKRKDYFPHHLYYSVRKVDLEKAGLELDEIMSYISIVTQFFRE